MPTEPRHVHAFRCYPDTAPHYVYTQDPDETRAVGEAFYTATADRNSRDNAMLMCPAARLTPRLKTKTGTPRATQP